jgi:hypothetical protein
LNRFIGHGRQDHHVCCFPYGSRMLSAHAVQVSTVLTFHCDTRRGAKLNSPAFECPPGRSSVKRRFPCEWGQEYPPLPGNAWGHENGLGARNFYGETILGFRSTYLGPIPVTPGLDNGGTCSPARQAASSDSYLDLLSPIGSGKGHPVACGRFNHASTVT